MDFSLLVASYAQRRTGPSVSQQQMLYEALREAILDGKITPGMRLLPTRVFAETLAVARNSVLYAYERLGDEGFVTAGRRGTIAADLTLRLESPVRRDSGRPIVAASTIGASNALSKSSNASPIVASNDTIASLAEPGPLSPGVPALDAFPIAKWRSALDRAWRQAGTDALGYAHRDGHPRLQRAVADYLRVSRGVRCSAEQIIITDGTHTSLDICARTLLSPNDTVWLENPGYAGARAAFRSASLTVVPIDVDINGIAPTPEHWRHMPPKLIYLTPSHQYPLGSVLPMDRRIALLDNARAHGSWIVEDDYDSEFRHDAAPLPALQGLIDNAPVVYVGTFSKTLFPALRIGFMVMPTALSCDVARTTREIRRQGRIVDQIALAGFIESGAYTTHLKRMRRLYAQRRLALREAIARHLQDRVTLSGGADAMHLTVRLDSPTHDVDVRREAALMGLSISPLSPYCHPQAQSQRFNGFVLGYANLPTEDAARHMQTLAAAIDRAGTGT